MTKWLALAALLLGATSSPAAAADNPAAQQLFDSAHGPASLIQSATGPFDLEVDFIMQFNKPIHGHLSLQWQSKDHWRSKLDAAGFQQTIVNIGDERYTLGNLAYTPEELEQLYSLLDLQIAPGVSTAKKISRRTIDGIALTCIKAKVTALSTPEEHEVCLDASSHNIVSDERKAQQPETTELFSDYFDFQGIPYPRSLRLLKEKEPVITASVISLAATSHDPALLIPPPGSIQQRECSNMTGPTLVQHSVLDLSSTGLHNAKITASFTVLADGSVGKIVFIYLSSPKLAIPALNAMKKWRYKPATCGKEPIIFHDLKTTMDMHSNGFALR